jgi:hypothetical protein
LAYFCWAAHGTDFGAFVYKGVKNETGNKLELLRQRETELRAKIAAEVQRQQKRRWREFDRLRNIIGGALLSVAEENKDFGLMLRQALQAADIAPSDRAFLKAKGWQ